MKSSRRALLHAGATASLLSLPMTAMAIPFQLGPIAATIDSTISAGVSMRVEGTDPTLVGITNGGTARSVNDDDGNLGFESGDVTSANLKVSHDLEFKHQNYGVFSRVSYFYDQTSSTADELEDRKNAAGNITTARRTGSYELGPRGRDRLGAEFRLLDLFAYGNFDLGGRSLSVRAGKQVINWGESTFIGNSINSINPVDVSRLRQPGAELKEALLPTPIISAQLQITGDLSIEGIYLAAYDKTQIDPRGAYFSTNDFVSDDGNQAIVSFGRREDQNKPTRVPGGPNAGSASVWVPRQDTRDPDNTTNQYGFALRYFAEPLNNTEFGLFMLKYHSRTPLVSGIRGGATNVTSTTPTCASSATTGCRGTFFSEFPENIELYGLSFNTTAPYGVAVQGEYSFRPNQPIQLSGTEVLLAVLGAPNSISGTPQSSDRATPYALGDYVQGYRNVTMHQSQVTLTKAFGPTAGAEQFVLLGEVGVTHLELPDNMRFGGPGAGLPACGFGTPVTVANGSCQSEGFATDNSWGYRIVGRMDFENVVGAVQISPRLVFAQDVNGVSPTFNEGTKAITAGIGFNYLQRWQADIGYTTFFGGRTYAGTDPVPPGADVNPDPNVVTLSTGDSSQSQSFATSANPSKDRDFVAVSVSYAF
ncbi:MAG: DUF1302 domain-containing protein [Pseudomonadota bacterium]